MTKLDHPIHGSGAAARNAPVEPAPGAPGRRRWLVLAVMVVCLVVVVLDNTVLNVALPRIQQELGASQSQQEWIIDAYTLVFAALLLPYGVLADRLGRRRVLFAGLAVFGVASFAAAFASSPGMLIGLRVVMAAGLRCCRPRCPSSRTSSMTRSGPGRSRSGRVGPGWRPRSARWWAAACWTPGSGGDRCC